MQHPGWKVLQDPTMLGVGCSLQPEQNQYLDVSTPSLLQMLSLFDADLDFKSSRVRLWRPGTIADVAASEGLVEVPAAVLNESGGTDGQSPWASTCTCQMQTAAASVRLLCGAQSSLRKLYTFWLPCAQRNVSSSLHRASMPALLC